MSFLTELRAELKKIETHVSTIIGVGGAGEAPAKELAKHVAEVIGTVDEAVKAEEPVVEAEVKAAEPAVKDLVKDAAEIAAVVK